MTRRAPVAIRSVDDQDDTRLRLLDVAETLFARHGIDNVSLRSITLEAETNVAAIHYHFGSKDELLQEIFIRRMTPLIAERTKRLTALIEAQQGRSIPAIVEAYVMPAFEYDCSQNNFGFNRLLARLSLEDRKHRGDLLYFILGDGDAIFIETLMTATGADREGVELRLMFLLGMLIQAMAYRARSPSVDSNKIAAELIESGAAIFRKG